MRTAPATPGRTYEGGVQLAGKVHSMIVTLIDRRAQGDTVAAAGVRVRLLLRGIDADDWGPTSDDDPVVIAKLEQMLAETDTMGVSR